MRDLVRTFRGLRHGDLPLTILLSGTYALTLFGVYLLKPARDSLFLSAFSSDDLPLAFILTAVVAIPVSLIYGRASRRWGLGPLFAGSFIFLVLCLVAWRFLLAAPSVAASYLFYAFAGIAGGLVASQFWLLGGALCDAQQAKRLFPLLSLGGIAGAALGGWAASHLARSAGFGSLDLILLCAGVWTVALALAILALKQRRPDPTPSRRLRHQERPDRLMWREITGSRHLLLIMGIVSVSMLVSTFVDFLFKSAAVAAHPGSDQLLAYLGTFYARMNLASLLLQLLLTTRLLRGLGVGASLLVLPSLLTLGAGALLVAPGLATAAILRGSEMGLKYSLDKTSRELLYLPLPLGLKRRVKVFIDTFVERGSRGLAGLVLLLTTSVLGFSPRATTLVVLVLLAVWLGLAVSMRRQYIEAFRQAVARRDIGRDDLRQRLRGPEVLATLEASLGADSAREVSYALSVLRSVAPADLPAGVSDLLDHPAAEVRQRALGLLVDLNSGGHTGRVTALLEDPDPETGRLAAAYLHGQGGDAALQQVLAGSLAARCSGLLYLARTPHGKLAMAPLPVAELEEQLHAAPPEPSRYREAMAEYLGRIWDGELVALCDLLAAQEARVIGSALMGLARRGDRRHLEPLARLLGQRALRSWARRALTGYGPVAIPTLVPVLTGSDHAMPVRLAAMRALTRLPYQRTVDALLARIDAAGSDRRGLMLTVLLRLRERRPELKFPGRIVDRILRVEIAASRRLLELVTRLGEDRPDPADRLLRRCLRETRHRHHERIFQLLALRYDHRDIMGAWLRFGGDDRRRRADAEEFLENILTPRHKMLLLTLFDVDPRWRRADRREALRQLVRSEELWLRCCAIQAVSPADRLHDQLETIRREGPPLAAETAAMVLDADGRRSTMLTTIEKAILLEGVDHFDAVDSEHLAAIAIIAEEVTAAEDEAIYRAGDPGDAMYLVVDGQVSLRRGGVEISRAESPQAFGAWALFEAESRMVDAVAAVPCRLLRIDREDFADLMAEDVDVAQSLLQSVARRLRQLASRAA